MAFRQRFLGPTGRTMPCASLGVREASGTVSDNTMMEPPRRTPREPRFTTPCERLPGVLFVHGWDSDQAHYQDRADDVAAMGCVALTFDLRGHGSDASHHATVNRAENLEDVLAAFDQLASHPRVDPARIAVLGTSYGGYLAAIASAARPVRWLGLRVPALYEDDQWLTPKYGLDRERVMSYRRQPQEPAGNRALSACTRFEGDALVVGSSEDRIVPRATISSYVRAFGQARSMTHRSITQADHELSDERARRTYDRLLSAWLKEMLLDTMAQYRRQ